jgi:hypothetical protein
VEPTRPPRRSGGPGGTGMGLRRAPPDAWDRALEAENTAPVALSGGPGFTRSLERVDGCARKRFRCDDAPIRRSGPPRHRAGNATGGRSHRPRCASSPCSASAEAPAPRWAIEPPNRASSTRVGRSRERPADRPRAAARTPQPKPRVPFTLRLHPPRWAGVGARRNLTKQPTSRLCSADESVVTSRRCQRPATRSFHGLCFLSKVHAASAPTRRCQTGRRARRGPKPAVRAPVARSSWRQAARVTVQMESLLRFTLPARRRSGSRDRRFEGPKPYPAATPFQRRGESPEPLSDRLTRPKPSNSIEAVRPESVRKSRS